MRDLSPLRALRHLESLDVGATAIPGEQVKSLKEAIPGLEIVGNDRWPGS